MKNKKKQIFLILLILLIAMFSGYLLFSKKSSSNNSKEISDTSFVQESNVSKVTKNQDISNHVTSENLNSLASIKQPSDIFSMYYNKAEILLKSMTLEEKVGQMFLARYPGSSEAIYEIASENPGGYILFGKDFANKTKEDIRVELANNQSYSKIGLLLAVDEEGGSVNRVSSYTNFRTSKFKSPQELFNIGGLKAILDDSKEKSTLLKSLGLNMNLVPVADVPTTSSSFIYDRAYSTDAKNNSIYTSELIKAMNSDGIISSIKHFPRLWR